MPESNHRLAAVMFTDIVGYTALMGRNESKAIELLRKNRLIHKPLIAKYNGKWIKEMGDGVLAQFNSAYNAVKCAVEIQHEAKKKLNKKLRIGLHLGEIIVENEDIFGDGVNIASRIESIAEPGGIYLSETVQRALNNHPDIRLQYIGAVALKNVDDSVKIYYVIGEDLAVPTKEKISQLKNEKSLSSKRFFKRPVYYWAVAVLLLLIIAIKYSYHPKKLRPVEAVAVLPFANFTGSPEQQYFVDMLQDAVISELSKINDLTVLSRTSTIQFRESKLSVPEIAKILNVDAVIESSVTKAGDSIYMQVQLIRARPKENHIWAKDFTRSTKNVMSLYGDLAKTVASGVEIQLSPEEAEQLTHQEEVDPEAYRAYLKGQYFWNKLSKTGLDSAEYYFSKSLEKDPDFALAYAGLATVALGRAQNGLIPFYESAITNIRFLHKAMEMDSTEAAIHFLEASFKTWGTWDFEEADASFKKAMSLNPNFAMLRVYYSHLLCYYHKCDEAVTQGKYALRLDPLNNLVKGIYGMMLNNCRKYEQADSVFNSVLAVDPFNSIALSNLKSTYHMQKKYAEAYALWKKDVRNDPQALEVLERGYQIGGYPQALENLADLMVERSKTEFITPWRICTLYTRAGLSEKALEYLEKAYDVHDQNMPYIASDPIFDILRDHAKFKLIMEKMHFPV